MRIFDRELAAPKRWRRGTHRARPPAETLARARRIARKVGVTRLADLTGLDCVGVPVFSAIRPNGRSLSTSQGKGLDADAAATSALMESIETWHAEHMTNPRRRARRSELPGAVDLRKLPRVGRVDPGARLDWVEGWDLWRAAPAWVPAESVTLDCVFAGAEPTFDVSSNGLASGNHLLEAIGHALCEVIERDAEARWRAERGQTRVDLETLGPDNRALVARIRRAGIHVTVWDLTSDLGVPAFGAALMEDPTQPSWRALGIHWGFGCHLSPEIAVSRAICEAAQTRVTYIAGSRDDFFPFDYERTTDPELLEDIWRDVTRKPRRAIDLRRVKDLAGRSFEADVSTLIERIDGPAIVVDLSRHLPVVKAIVPGRATRVELMG